MLPVHTVPLSNGSTNSQRTVPRHQYGGRERHHARLPPRIVAWSPLSQVAWCCKMTYSRQNNCCPCHVSPWEEGENPRNVLKLLGMWPLGVWLGLRLPPDLRYCGVHSTFLDIPKSRLMRVNMLLNYWDWGGSAQHKHRHQRGQAWVTRWVFLFQSTLVTSRLNVCCGLSGSCTSLVYV